MPDFLSQPVIKAISLKDLPEEAWKVVEGADQGDLATLVRRVPWMFAGVELRAAAMGAMPFAIYRGTQEVDSSAKWQNALGFLPNPAGLFWLIETALCTWGYAYLEREHNMVGTKGLRYLLPTSISPVIDAERGLVGFTRAMPNERIRLQLEDVVYFWRPDPFVELGPPRASPVQAAAAPANVLVNLNDFAAAFFKRGAVKTTLLTVSGDVVSQERERLEAWWQRVARGVRNAFASHLLNADKITPVVIGEGLEELTNDELSLGTRAQIAAALGVPDSLLFSSQTSHGVSQQDDLHFYTKTVVPECRFIEGVMNEQVLGPAGYRLEFRPQALSLFQHDEERRSSSLAALVGAGVPLDLGAEILGFDMTAEQWSRLRRRGA